MRFKGALRIWMVICLMLIPGILGAEETEVRASVDRIRMALGESLQLTVTLIGEDGVVDVSPVQDFEIISRGSATNINMINGRFSRENSYVYTLMPLKSGELKVPSLPVESDGKIYRTEAITVSVTKSNEPDRAGERDVFVEARISNAAPYAGEQIVYSFRLFQAVQIANARFQEPPFTGFTAQRVEDQRTFKTVISGREYHVTELDFILLSLDSGPRRIESATLNCDVVHTAGRRQSPFDDPFFGISGRRFESRRFTTDPLSVTVRPLAPYEGEGRFSGLVGSFEVESRIETRELQVGDSTTMSIVIQGAGNVMDAEEPAFVVSDAFKVYKDAPEESIRLEATGFAGKKVFRMALVPVKPGEYLLDPVRLVYFDSDREEYVSKFTDPVRVMVKPAEKDDRLTVFSAGSPEQSSRKDRVVFTGRDILPLKENLDALENRRPMSAGWFLLYLGIPPLLIGGIRTAMALTRKSDDPSRIMMERSENAVRKASSAKSEDEVFFTLLHRSIISAVLAKAGTLGEALTHSEVRSILNRCGYSPEIQDQALNLLERIESARFGGMSTDAEERQGLLNRTREFLKVLNR